MRSLQFRIEQKTGETGRRHLSVLPFGKTEYRGPEIHKMLISIFDYLNKKYLKTLN